MIESGIAVLVLVGGYLMGTLLCGRRWLAYWHGRGAPHQHEYFRCEGCRRLVTWRRIHAGGCRCRSSIKLRPAMLSRADKARLLWAPWTVR